ncbi:MAG: hypothetical protein WBF93_19670, partial [Pirellulales bacterium]
HRYWSGQHGGKDPFAAYRKFVKAGLKGSSDPKLDRLRDWVYGSEDFLKRMLAMAAGDDAGANRRRGRRMHPVSRSMRSWKPPRSNLAFRLSRIAAIEAGPAAGTWQRFCVVAGPQQHFGNYQVDSV